jgi:hypothetical protein
MPIAAEPSPKGIGAGPQTVFQARGMYPSVTQKLGTPICHGSLVPGSLGGLNFKPQFRRCWAAIRRRTPCEPTVCSAQDTTNDGSQILTRVGTLKVVRDEEAEVSVGQRWVTFK